MHVAWATGAAESHHAARKLRPSCHYRNLVGWIPWLEWGYRWLQAVQKGRRGRMGTGVPLYIEKWIECEELSLKNNHEQVESLWIRIKDQGNKESLVVDVYYRLPNQGEPIHEAFLLQLREASRSQALILLREFNPPNNCWKTSTVSHGQSKRLLECMEDNF